MFLLKMMLINDKPPQSGYLPVPQGWPLNGGLTGSPLQLTMTTVLNVITSLIVTINPLLSPRGGLKERGGLFNLAKRITCSKNTVV